MEYSLDNILSRAPSSRSPSISALTRQNTEGLNDHSIPPTLALPFGGTESVSNPFLTPIVTDHDKISIERDRAMATTPLLPPLMTGAIGKPPMVSSAAQSPHLISKLPLAVPASLLSISQDHDKWSDRLEHANFTISPAPYDLSAVSPETIAKFQNDWGASRCNYTKHLVRTGETTGRRARFTHSPKHTWAHG
ncbi:hypothetical protein NHJ6243_009952 [Beauveria neobassiana]